MKNVAILDISDVDNVVPALNVEFPNQPVVYFKTDVSDKANVQSSFKQAKERFGHIDVVIANAGIFNENQPERLIQINLVSLKMDLSNRNKISNSCIFTDRNDHYKL